MRRSDRLFEIVQILRRARSPITAHVIATELGTSKRSIYRDMAALIAQRVPITGEAGIGYVLDRGFDMPPLMLTSDEIEAAMLGAQWVATRGEPELALAALNLIAKIEVALPARLRPYLLEPALSVAPVQAPPAEIVSPAALRAAIRSGRKVALAYRDAEGRLTRRVVWPVLLGYRDSGRILAAWCELRSDFRYFLLERMAAAEVLCDRYPQRPAILRRSWQQAMDKERERYQDAAPPKSA